jgi:acetylornithine deacetylase/succinyl-diaminopimelate desuccinylase-like protein
LLATSGEETGSHLGMRWLLARHPELVARFGLFLTEGGAVEGRSPDDVKYWGTEFAQKRLVEVTLCGGDRAVLEGIRRELLEERQRADRLEVTPEVARFLAHYAPTRDHAGLRRLLGDPRAFIRDAAAYHRHTAYLRAMFRDEVAPHQVAEAPGGGYELRVYVTLLPGRETADAVADFFPPGRLHGLAAAVYDDGAAHHGSPPDHPVFADIEAAIHARYPRVPTGPLFLPWTLTDARFVRNHDVPAYGFSPFMVLTPEVVKLSQFGKVDERIALPGFVEGVEVYADLLERLTD